MFFFYKDLYFWTTTSPTDQGNDNDQSVLNGNSECCNSFSFVYLTKECQTLLLGDLRTVSNCEKKPAQAIFFKKKLSSFMACPVSAEKGSKLLMALHTTVWLHNPIPKSRHESHLSPHLFPSLRLIHSLRVCISDASSNFHQCRVQTVARLIFPPYTRDWQKGPWV